MASCISDQPETGGNSSQYCFGQARSKALQMLKPGVVKLPLPPAKEHIDENAPDPVLFRLRSKKYHTERWLQSTLVFRLYRV